MCSDKATAQHAHERHARMKVPAAVLMSRRHEAFSTELVDISATGVLLKRPPRWSGAVGQVWVLDIVFAHDLHINMEAEVARVSARQVGLKYSLIPEDKQGALWDLLGGYADTLEEWHDE
ncbi:PilZ domain-containing protein [Luteibacter sp. PPL201]|uniref:PilZ domain-containing protein n=1 Tax=Luteibacter sahnii TaxID=3021977 RepID=A0ABT6B7M9_9GAMM|nr:PilZ domain-containing protein [Luteibacter sp. PPL193]MDY1547972.1 PilZ domain-containing protein [Luteibacter sp. PPL193]